MNNIQVGALAGVIAGTFTGIGALPLLFVKKISKTVEDTLLGFAAGIMIFASSFSLVLPALEDKNIYQTIFGLLCGAIIMNIIERIIPHIHIDKIKGLDFKDKTIKNTVLMLFTMLIHSIPEGLAIGVGFTSGNPKFGLAIAIAIGIQNAPEGLVLAAPLLEKGYSKVRAIAFGFLAGIGEPIATILGLYTGKSFGNYMPFILSLAAGAMYYVVSHELIPESHCKEENQTKATYGVIFGFITMIIIDYIVK